MERWSGGLGGWGAGVEAGLGKVGCAALGVCGGRVGATVGSHLLGTPWGNMSVNWPCGVLEMHVTALGVL